MNYDHANAVMLKVEVSPSVRWNWTSTTMYVATAPPILKQQSPPHKGEFEKPTEKNSV